MDKNKSFYLTVVVIFCVVLSGLGGYFLGTHFGENSSVTKKACKDSEEVEVSENIPELSSNVKVVLYNYLKDGNGDLFSYLNGLSNSQKLYLAGINSEISFSELKQNLIDTFGSDLGLLAEDYYVGETLQAKYDAESDKFVWTGDTDLLFDFESIEVYNYKVYDNKETSDEVSVDYYGLFAYTDNIGPTTLTNDNNIKRLIGFEQEGDDETDEEYLENAFNTNKDDFFKFNYVYKKVNGMFVLTGFSSK